MSFIVGNGVTALPLAEWGGDRLLPRTVSTLVLAPIVLGAVLAGRHGFALVVALAGTAMAWEWARITRHGRFGVDGWVMVAAVLLAIAAAVVERYGAALALAFGGSATVYAVARLARLPHPGWAAPCVAVVAVPGIALLWLRGWEPQGLQHVVWLLGAVWMTDLGAFAVGRTVGGWRLAPRLSPRKTWSGLIGGTVSAALWGATCAVFLDVEIWPLALASAMVAPIAQAGDLSISVVKRRFGVKDSSRLIPGHGGVLDRTDGLLTTAPALTVLLWIKGSSVFLWQ